MRLLIENGTLVGPNGRRRASVLCESGKISAIAEDMTTGSSDERYDASGQLVFPGFIDPHVHSRDPGQTEKEDFAHSTLGALASGVTTILEMPNAIPPVTTSEVLRDRIALHSGRAWTDFGLWGQALGESNADDIAHLFSAGAVAMKLFWGYALDKASKRLVYNLADIEPDTVVLPPDLGAILKLFGRTAASGGVIAAHCEDRELLEEAGRRVGTVVDNADLVASRPAVAEATSVAIGIELARATGARFHVVHVSSGRTVELIRRARAEGLEVTGEACPHYLVSTDGDTASIRSPTKVYPPIRDAGEQRELWAGILDDTITTLGSDHAPHTPAEKAGTLAAQPAGIHGVETMVPLMLDQMIAGRISPERIAGLLSRNTAMLYGLGHRKGDLRIGADADFTIVDPAAEWRIDERALHTLHKMTVFHGTTGRGKAVSSVLRGEIVMRGGEPVGTPRGVFIPAKHRADAETGAPRA